MKTLIFILACLSIVETRAEIAYEFELQHLEICGFVKCKDFGHLENIIQAAYDNGFTTIAKLLVDFDLVEPILSKEYVTLFAPSNKAFEKIWPKFNSLTYEEARAILKRHIVPSLLNAEDLYDGQKLLNLNQDFLVVMRDNLVPTENLFLATHTDHYAQVLTFEGKVEIPYAVLHSLNRVLV